VQIRTWINDQYEEGEPEFEFVYEDSPFQAGLMTDERYHA